MTQNVQKKLKAVLVVIILCTTSIIIIQNNTTNVLASEPDGEGDFTLSTDFIHRVTENLSNVIYTAYNEGEFRKGRSFGSKGEHYAADYIYDLMNELGLSNVHKERITNVSGSDEVISVLRGGDGNLTIKLDILNLGCCINNSGDIQNVDCYISPQWNSGIHDKNYDKNLLTHNVSYDDLSIVKAENYTFTDTFLQNVSVEFPLGRRYYLIPDMPFFNTLQDYKLTRNLSIEIEREFQQAYDFDFDTINPENPSTFPSY